MQTLWRSSAAVLALIAGASSAAADSKEAWRLFVADRDQAKVTVIDAIQGELLETFTMKSPASLYRSNSGRTVFAVQGDGCAVTAIAQHRNFRRRPWRSWRHRHRGAEADRNVDIAGEKPSHFVDHDGDIRGFFRRGRCRRGSSPRRRFWKANRKSAELKTGAPQHGVAVAYGSHVLLSEPNKEKAGRASNGHQDRR
jgi:zinc transport system substrate-binding protein